MAQRNALLYDPLQNLFASVLENVASVYGVSVHFLMRFSYWCAIKGFTEMHYKKKGKKNNYKEASKPNLSANFTRKQHWHETFPDKKIWWIHSSRQCFYEHLADLLEKNSTSCKFWFSTCSKMLAENTAPIYLFRMDYRKNMQVLEYIYVYKSG